MECTITGHIPIHENDLREQVLKIAKPWKKDKESETTIETDGWAYNGKVVKEGDKVTFEVTSYGKM